MTISPPANVKTPLGESARVLAHNIDSLVLSFDVTWADETLFAMLGALRHRAEALGEEVPGELCGKDGSDVWLFNIRPHGGNGYAWLLVGREFTLKVGGWLKPQQRPSVVAEIRSETLWAMGPDAAVVRVCRLIESAGGAIGIIKVSRSDLCVDVLLPEINWQKDLIDHLVTRAQDVSLHFHCGELTGCGIGKGDISARFYDKPREIASKSHKFWMYDIWGEKEVPPGHRIIRIEYQLRREKLTELGINTWADLQRLSASLWVYCTEKWLKVQDAPDKHHTQQQTLGWWKVVQDGYPGAAQANPLVPAKAINVDRQQLNQQLAGFISSLLALNAQDRGLEDGALIELDRNFPDLLDGLIEYGLTDERLTDVVIKKLAKWRRGAEKKIEPPPTPNDTEELPI